MAATFLREASDAWPKHLPTISWHHQEDDTAPFGADGMDIVTTSCVLHHIVPVERDRAISEMTRTTKTGGKLVVFEHSPFDPLARLVIARSPLDKNAILLTPTEVVSRVKKAGLTYPRCDYLLFFPPRLRQLDRLDDALKWLPPGGQYMVVAEE